MSFIDGIARSQAASAINTYGKTATLNKLSTGTYNPATGSVTGSLTAYAVKVLIEAYKANLIDGTIIQASDYKATLAALNNQAPDQDDTLTVDGVTGRIVSVGPIYAGEQIAVYVLQVRT